MAGISPLESWDYTWGEGIEAVTAYVKRENDRARKQAVALYNAAVFLIGSLNSAFTGGSLKKFHEVFPGFEDPAQKGSGEMSDDAMYAQVRALNALFGGKEA